MKKIFIIIIVVFSLASCSDKILDLEPTDRIAEEMVWKDPQLIRGYVTELYNCNPHGYDVQMQSKATDEVVFTQPWGPGMVILGTMTPDLVKNGKNAVWNGGCRLYVWDNHYLNIRKMNVFLKKMEETDLEFDDKDRWIAEVRVLRAYLYWELIIRFQGVPLITDVYELTDEVTYTRDTFEDCVEFIEAELTAAMPYLPEAIHADEPNAGRMHQSIIKAIRSEMYLYLASPQYSPTKDLAKWQLAADAALDLIDDGNYSLHPDITTLFNQPSGSVNNELIYTRQFTVSDRHLFPMHNLGRRWSGYGGWWASNGPSQNLVDDFDMINGEPAFIHVNYVPTTINPASGYNPQAPYKNRDPRFNLWIDHDSTYQGGIYLEKWIGNDGSYGYDTYKQSGDNPRCGYTMGKFVQAGVPLNRETPYTNPYVFIRLAEIYLNYAEAMFELGDEDVCREYMNKIRNRAGMPDIPESVTGEDLRQRLYNERRIEMCFEEQRYWDVRRWDIAKYTEPLPLRGMVITLDVATGVKSYASENLIARPPYDKIYDWLPLSTDELQRTFYSLTQTPGWE